MKERADKPINVGFYEKSSAIVTVKVMPSEKELWERQLGNQLPSVVREFLNRAASLPKPAIVMEISSWQEKRTATIGIKCTPSEKWLWEMAFHEKLAVFVQTAIRRKMKKNQHRTYVD